MRSGNGANRPVVNSMNRSHLITALASFVVGVFVGAGLWVALVVLAAGLVAWRWLGPPPPPNTWLHRR